MANAMSDFLEYLNSEGYISFLEIQFTKGIG